MSTPQERIEVFNDTIDWINSDPDLSASIPIAKNHTAVYFADQYPHYISRDIQDTKIYVTGNRSFEAAMKLHKENPTAKIAVMNFANSITPGGGVKNGSNAQEEALCRISTLYPLLYRNYLEDNFYSYHRKKKSPRASDSLIYTSGVIICKSDEDHPKRLPKEEWVSVDVITVAAPDLRDQPNVHFDLIGGGTDMTDAEQFGYHVKRAIHILTCAAAEGADILVLGAFGCGAFRNNPEVVAKAYKVALEVFPNVFSKVEFAVYRPASGSVNYDIFKKILG